MLSNGSAERSALLQSGELLCTPNAKGAGLDLHAEIERRVGRVWSIGGILLALWRWLCIQILVLLGLFIQIESEFILAFMTNGQVGEDEVARFCWAVQVGHARDRHSRQDGRRLSHGREIAALSHGTRQLERCEQEEVGLITKGDIFSILALALTFVDAQLDDGWWIDRSSVGG